MTEGKGKSENNDTPRVSVYYLIREEVLDTLTQYEKFWLIFKDGTYGLAGLLDLNYKRSYIELLFHPPNKGKALLEIYSPLVNELNFSPLLEEPPMSSAGFVSPQETVKTVLDLAESTIQAYQFILNNEVRKLDEVFENYQIGLNKFHRRIFVYLFELQIELEIDFSKYPRRPIFKFSDKLNSIIPLSEFKQNPVIKEWDELNPVNISYLLEVLINLIAEKTKYPPFSDESQQIIFENVQSSDVFKKYSFEIHRGQSFGVIFNTTRTEAEEQEFMMEMFRSITGMKAISDGAVTIYGRTTPLKYCSIVTHTLEPNLASKSVKNALFTNLKLYPAFRSQKRNKLLKKVLNATGLINKQTFKLNELSRGESLRFNIGRAVLQAPEVILLIMHEGALNKFDINQFNQYINMVKQEFHSMFILTGIRDIASSCDKVLTITEESTSAGFISELVLQIPQAGEIITIELNKPPTAELEKMLSIPNAQFIEERREEKYRIYSEEDPDDLILKILHVVGAYLYNFKRTKPSLEDYLQFKALIE